MIVKASLASSNLTRFVTKGSSQGGILSSLIWNVAVNELLRTIEGGGWEVIAYADVVTKTFTGKFSQALCNRLVHQMWPRSKFNQDRDSSVHNMPIYNELLKILH